MGIPSLGWADYLAFTSALDSSRSDISLRSIISKTNNACATGSTAMFLARSQVEGGLYDCVLALGFEKMQKGPLGGATPNTTDDNPMAPHMVGLDLGLDGRWCSCRWFDRLQLSPNPL